MNVFTPAIVSTVTCLVLSLAPAVSPAQSSPSQPTPSASTSSLAGPPRVWIGGDTQTLGDPQLKPVIDCVARTASEFGLTVVDGQQPRQYTIEFSQAPSASHRREMLDELASAADQAQEATLNRLLRCPEAAPGKRCLRAAMTMERSMQTPIRDFIRQSGQTHLNQDLLSNAEGVQIFSPAEGADATCAYFVERALKPIRINQKLLVGAEEQVRAARPGSAALPRQP